MAGKRKLFITHAGELAHRLAHTVGRGGLVSPFIHSYAQQHDRRTLLHNFTHLRELEATIGREALLVMALEVGRLVPRAFASGRHRVLRPEEKALSQVFWEEFVASLGRTQETAPQEILAERENFQKDLARYDRWTVRRSPNTPRGKSSTAVESPFADRCALLLDPSMMEEARHAAAEFGIELVRIAARLFEQLGRRSMTAARRARRSPQRSKKSRRRARKSSKVPTKRSRPVGKQKGHLKH